MRSQAADVTDVQDLDPPVFWVHAIVNVKGSMQHSANCPFFLPFGAQIRERSEQVDVIQQGREKAIGSLRVTAPRPVCERFQVG